jgi:hypothetical protein
LVQDVRPFLWHNYHEPNKPRFRLDLRYTSYLDLSGAAPGNDRETALLEAMEPSRRQGIRYARQSGAAVQAGADWQPLLSLYSQTMTRQGAAGKDLQAATIKMGAILAALTAHGSGAVYLLRNSENRELASAAAFGWDSRRAYYLYGLFSVSSG